MHFLLLQKQDAANKLPDVLPEVSRVGEDLGFPPLVALTSQITGSEALLNVLLGLYKISHRIETGVIGYEICTIRNNK